ncbi:hypothetical protein SK128_025956 [Halocaridina rubra]|uniref:Uncharacterized protein n=1 Tax=Halocaridina rubra TaxID=373956 RepID=A0AAN8WRL2_HALRR
MDTVPKVYVFGMMARASKLLSVNQVTEGTTMIFSVTIILEKDLKIVHRFFREEGIGVCDEITSHVISDIDLMIGCDFFGDFISGMVKHDNINMLQTPGGYIPFGKIPPCFSDNSKFPCQANVLICRLTVNDSPVDVMGIIEENIEPVRKLWELESIDTDPAASDIADELAYKRLTVNDSLVDVMGIIEENIEPVHKLWELESIDTEPAASDIADELAYKRYVDSVEYRHVLGLNWNVNSDFVSLKPVSLTKPEVVDKHKLPSLVSTIFDPHGILSPVINRRKIPIQTALRTDVSWNDP